MANQLVSLISTLVLVVIAGCHQTNNPQRQTSQQIPEATAVDRLITPRPAVEGQESKLRATDTVSGKAGHMAEFASDTAAIAMTASPASQNLQAYGYTMLNQLRQSAEPVNRENYAHYDDNAVRLVSEHPVSTFSIDVDTGAYANVRRMINSGRLPPHDAVRVEEFINYFSYEYSSGDDKGSPFMVAREVAPAPWNPDKLLLQIGIKAQDIMQAKLPNANLVFLVDVSGSMQSPTRLGLLKSSLKLLARRLRSNDKVSLVVYAGASGVVLTPTAGNQTAVIDAALDQLTAGGSTNGGAGIKLAYSLAEQAFIPGGINRVILATDGDFNVGTVDHEQLINLIEEKRNTGISLSTLGFGAGNYNDRLLEQLADKGNGNYAYIDTLNEAQKVLVDEISATLLTVAKDVKIQIEFNPAAVGEYRLIGFENRHLNREDFNNDKVDAGEIGAGHTVTAMYELKLNNGRQGLIDPLRYQQHSDLNGDNVEAEELAFLKIRYKQPEADSSRLLSWAIASNEIRPDIKLASTDFRFAAAVAAFAQQLRGGKYLGNYACDSILELARGARGQDPFGYRGEFLSLVNLAQSLGMGSRQQQDWVN